MIESQSPRRFALLEWQQRFMADLKLWPTDLRIGPQAQLQFIPQESHRCLGGLADIVHRLLRHDHLDVETHSPVTNIAHAVED
jgi:hypothetical protein